MSAKFNVFRILGAFVFAMFAVIVLVISAQPSEAATTKFQVKKVSYSKEYKMDDGSVYFSITGEFPTIKDDSEVAEKINKVLKKEKNRLVHQYDKYLSEFKEEYEYDENYAKENGEDFDWRFGDEIHYKVTANNGKYFSVILSGFLYEDVEYGTEYRSCFTFDVQTGKRLTAANLFKISKKQLNNKVRKLYLAKIDKNCEKLGFYPISRDEIKKSLKKLNFNNTFYVKDNGKVVFYTEPYEFLEFVKNFIEVFTTIK